jgi:excisionase family DNA binding protein
MSKEYTVKEAASILGVSSSRIRQLVLAKQIDHRYFGNMLVISEKGITQASQRKTKPGPGKQAA